MQYKKIKYYAILVIILLFSCKSSKDILIDQKDISIISKKNNSIEISSPQQLTTTESIPLRLSNTLALPQNLTNTALLDQNSLGTISEQPSLTINSVKKTITPTILGQKTNKKNISTAASVPQEITVNNKESPKKLFQSKGSIVSKPMPTTQNTTVKMSIPKSRIAKVKSKLTVKSQIKTKMIKEGDLVFAIEKFDCSDISGDWILFYQGKAVNISSKDINVQLKKRFSYRYHEESKGIDKNDWWCIPKKRHCYSEVKFSDWEGKYSKNQIKKFSLSHVYRKKDGISKSMLIFIKRFCHNKKQ